jgi:hypothetical protein
METIQSMLDNLEEDHLEHFGKKGMRWGVRSARSSGGAKPISKSKARANEIRAARARQASREFGVYRSAAKTVVGKKGTRGKQAMKTYDQTVNLFRNPDRKTAAKTTRGEKVAIGLLIGGIGALNVAAIASQT